MPGLGYDYTMRFIGCDFIQTCSFVSESFQSHTMIYREIQINRPEKSHRLKSDLIHDVICLTDCFVFTLDYCLNFKVIK